MELSKKAERFCLEYITDYSAQRAALRAGFSKKSGDELLKCSEVMGKILELQKELVNKNLLNSKERIIWEYWKIYERAMQAKSVTVWDKELKEYVETGEYQFDDKTAMKCLELITKLEGMISEKESEDYQNSNKGFELVVKVEKDEI